MLGLGLAPEPVCFNELKLAFRGLFGALERQELLVRRAPPRVCFTEAFPAALFGFTQTNTIHLWSHNGSLCEVGGPQLEAWDGCPLCFRVGGVGITASLLFSFRVRLLPAPV